MSAIQHTSQLLTDGRSEAVLSFRSSVRAIVFVHGFFGSPRGTWADFPEIVDLSVDRSWWANSDLYLYFYSSVRTQVGVSAKRLQGFISRIFPSPPASILKTRVPFLGDEFVLPKRQYRELILVGHSEGGLVIRAMLLNRLSELRDSAKLRNTSVPKQRGADKRQTNLVDQLSADSLLTSTLSLFAPSHLGRNVSALAALVPKYLLGTSNAYNNMAAGSAYVTSIKSRTEKAARRWTNLTGLVANSVFGGNENVVVVGQYDTDWAHQVIEDHDHTSICKPEKTFLFPVQFVKENHARTESVRAGSTR